MGLLYFKKRATGRGTPIRFGAKVLGGTVKLCPGFQISYVIDRPPCVLWDPPSTPGLSLTVLRSPSGSGKSTFLRKLYEQLQNHTEAGKELRFDFSPDRGPLDQTYVAFIPQHPPFVKHWHVSQILSKTPAFIGDFFTDEEAKKVVKQRIGQLSGGQWKRVYALSALDRLLHDDAKGQAAFLLLDETFDGLGPEGLSRCVASLQKRWCEKTDTPLYVLLVTHHSSAELKTLMAADVAMVMVAAKESTSKKLVVHMGNQ